MVGISVMALDGASGLVESTAASSSSSEDSNPLSKAAVWSSSLSSKASKSSSVGLAAGSAAGVCALGVGAGPVFFAAEFPFGFVEILSLASLAGAAGSRTAGVGVDFFTFLGGVAVSVVLGAVRFR